MKWIYKILILAGLAVILSGCLSEKIKLSGEYSLPNGESVTVQLGKPYQLSKNESNVTATIVSDDTAENNDDYLLEVDWLAPALDVNKSYMLEHEIESLGSVDIYEISIDKNDSQCSVSVPISRIHFNEIHSFRILDIDDGFTEVYRFDFEMKEVDHE